MALNQNQIPIYAITTRTDVGILSAATAGSMGTTTNTAVIFTASTAGSRVTALFANTTDTAAVNLFLSIVSSGATVVRPLGQINVPLSSGNLASTLNIDCLDPSVLKGLPIDNTGKRYIDLGGSETLRASTVANMTAAKACYITAIGADYQ